MGLSYSQPSHDTNDNSDFTYALGYSYNADPNFMYCAEDMTTINGTINWWLPSCGLTGGSSGGPWVQAMSGGSGPIISVNSWGYTNSPGMAGPKFYQTLDVLCLRRGNVVNDYPFREHPGRRRQRRSGGPLPVS